jgi:hypothetical protein
MKRILSVLLIVCFLLVLSTPAALAFCGFYVATADTKLYNQASQVVIARDGNRTILTMANDFKGDVKNFAIVVPVPVVLKKEQVKVGDPKVIAHLDAFSAPRLVEYFDSDPCAVMESDDKLRRDAAPASQVGNVMPRKERRDLGVTIEEKFSVGEYDILILSAKDSGGLETWLTQNGYKIPQGAKQVLRPYIRQNMKFFVAKVNLAALKKTDTQQLRPLLMAFDSPKFMLPIRLGMVNAIADQDLLVYILSSKGQVEVSNYRTVKVPSGNEIPVYVKGEFGSFYKSMFQTSYAKEGRNVAFLEYAWDMGSCDPCSAQPLSNEELKQAGVFWLNPSTGNNVFITRLHVRYTRDKFPEDLMFKQTPNREQFQGRYVLRHAFTGTSRCEAGKQYKKSLVQRQEQEAKNLAQLTGWNIQDIRKKANISQVPSVPFWQNIWR